MSKIWKLILKYRVFPIVIFIFQLLYLSHPLLLNAYVNKPYSKSIDYTENMMIKIDPFFGRKYSSWFILYKLMFSRLRCFNLMTNSFRFLSRVWLPIYLYLSRFQLQFRSCFLNQYEYKKLYPINVYLKYHPDYLLFWNLGTSLSTTNTMISRCRD